MFIRVLTTAFSVLAAIGAGGCGHAPGSPSATLAFSLSAAPATIAGALCTGCGAGSTDREARTTISIVESGGAAGTVTAIAMVLRENGTNTVLAQGQFDASAIASIAGTSRIAARGTLAVLCGVHYAAGLAGKPASLTYTVTITGDDGTTTTHDLVVPVSVT